MRISAKARYCKVEPKKYTGAAKHNKWIEKLTRGVYRQTPTGRRKNQTTWRKVIWDSEEKKKKRKKEKH